MKQVKPFFETECHKCGSVDEAKLILGSVHVKQVCNGCGAYVKFFNKALIPDIPEIKMKIWAVAEQDLSIIADAKLDIDFVPNLTGLYGKIMYWKLYLYLRGRASKQCQ